MLKTFSCRAALIAILCFVIFMFLGCSPQATLTPETTKSPEPATATEKVIPVASMNSEEVAIFSYEEDGYAHLFAYIPDKLPLRRITAGDWDDITPAPSPNGETIAFASNRNGFWDLYLLDLSSGEVTQLTNTPQYEGAPTWSPDGSFLAFESYEEDNLNIVVGLANDPLSDPITLTTSSASDHSPAWAPDGRYIAFISDGEVVLANLDRTDESRFQNLSHTDLASESHPVWSPDGKRLAWASSFQSVGQSGIYVWDSSRNVPAVWVGDGNCRLDTTGDQILTTLAAPNSTYLTVYSPSGKLLQALTPFPAPTLRGLLWAT